MSLFLFFHNDFVFVDSGLQMSLSNTLMVLFLLPPHNDFLLKFSTSLKLTSHKVTDIFSPVTPGLQLVYVSTFNPETL